jgi:hypothetical protein
LEFLPVMMQRILKGQGTDFTVPSQWPEDFDASWGAHENHRRETARIGGATAARLGFRQAD